MSSTFVTIQHIQKSLLFVFVLVAFSLTLSMEMTDAFSSLPSKQEYTKNHAIISNKSNGNVQTGTIHYSRQSDDDQDKQGIHGKDGIKLGFIGCGTIASSIATGLITQTQVPIASITVSRRSESKSSALIEKFGNDIIQISDENQVIVDRSDIIFLCVLPEHEKEVLGQLEMSEEKTLVSLVVRLSCNLTTICFVPLVLKYQCIV